MHSEINFVLLDRTARIEAYSESVILTLLNLLQQVMSALEVAVLNHSYSINSLFEEHNRKAITISKGLYGASQRRAKLRWKSNVGCQVCPRSLSGFFGRHWRSSFPNNIGLQSDLS